MSEKWSSYLDMFDEAVKKHTARTALICGDWQVSFGELDRASNVIAQALLEHSVTRGQIIPILLPRGPAVFAALLGAWKAGTAGTIVNMTYPAERIGEICRQCGGGLVIDEAWINARDPFAQGPVVTVKPVRPEREDLAMVIFTSGSTGSPKGVLIPHRTIAHRVAVNQGAYVKLGNYNSETEPYLNIVPLSSVIIICNELCFLIMGGSIVLTPDALMRDMSQVIRYAVEQRVSVSFVPPILAPLFLKHLGNQMHILFIGSERVSNIYDERVILCNGYGSSEGAGTNSFFIIDKKYENTPIGKPIEGTNLYLLDSRGNLVPPGEEGELCLSGETIALGYLNKKELTAERFTPNPFSDDPNHHTLYHTGDLARVNADGEYEYIQRVDWMLKIGGHRVEPGEIESAICRAAPVSKAVVVGFESRAGGSAQTRLYACYTAQETIDPALIQKELARILPAYMVPAFIEQVQSLPLNINGKIDRSKIVPPEIEYYRSDYEPPANDLEKTICDAFQDVLNIPSVGALDDFILLGGDSVSAAKLAMRLYRSTGLSVVDILLRHTPRALADMARIKGETGEDSVNDKNEDIQDLTVSVDVELTPYQAILYYDWLLNPLRTDYNIVEDRIYEGEFSPERWLDGYSRFVRGYFLCKSNIVSAGDHQYWKERDSIEEDIKQRVRYFDHPLTDEDVLSLVSRPFDLEKDPLFSFNLIKLSDKRYRYISAVHHIIIDGVKAARDYEEQAHYYNDAGYAGPMATGRQKALYIRLSEKLKVMINENRKSAEDFWKKYCLNTEPVDLQFLRRSREEQRNVTPISVYRFSLEKKEILRVRIISQKYGITPYIFAEMVFAILLNRMTRQNNISFCYPTAIVEGSDFIYGAQMNSMVINFSFGGKTTVDDLVQQAKTFYIEMESSKAKYLPINEITAYLPNKDILQVGFAQSSLMDIPIEFEGVTQVESHEKFVFDCNYTFIVLVEETRDRMNFKFKYKNQLLDENLVSKFAGMYQRLFVEMLDGLLSEQETGHSQ